MSDMLVMMAEFPLAPPSGCQIIQTLHPTNNW